MNSGAGSYLNFIQKIPRRFSQSIQGTWPAHFTLRDCHNNLWQVEVELVVDTWYFKDGWTEFAVDNMIEGGNMLVYEYSSHGLLDFKVHGRSACSTKGVGGHRTKNYCEGETGIDDCSDDDNCSPTTKEENDQDDYFEGVKVIDVTNVTDEDEYDLTTDEEENQPDDCLGIDKVMDVIYDSDDDDYFPTTEEGDEQEDYEVVDDDSDDDDYSPTTEEENDQDDYPEVEKVMDDDTEDDDYLPTAKKDEQREVDPNGNETINVDHDISCKREPATEDVNQERTQEEGQRDDSIQGVQLRDDGCTSTSKRKSTRDFDWYGVEIFQSGLIHQPNNPYFVTKIRKQRAYELYMPMDVIKSYGLQLPNTILLIDPRRREFRATRKMWSDGRTFYTGGWRSLCGMNQVKDDDSCICEFVQRGQDLCVHVSFFPPKEQQ
ncbi:hypothetical protein C2S52_013389 [Perilla frutescens var. hirtella]|nr:hypothetical protein C2S51_015688 [Perilla frutescens var. frutescens]KAH6775828.1 hypothetical protein C2S52_013389 [Perilla frutescens var. hirtella]